MLFNRDLSWLTFNHLVLQQARRSEVPLYERLKFMAIFSSNLDEFFRVRYPIIIAFSNLGKKTLKKVALQSHDDIPDQIQHVVNEQLSEFGQILLNKIIPELKEHNIFFYYNSRIRTEHYQEIKNIFVSKVLSFIQPIILGAEESNEFLPENNRLYLVVTVRDNLKETVRHIIVNIPSQKLNRFYSLSAIDGMDYVIFIDDIIRFNMELIFPALNIENIYSIKFNRDAGLNLDSEYSSDILEKFEKKLKKRDKGPTSRFLYEKSMPVNLRLFLASLFKVSLEDMFEGGRYHNLSDLMDFPKFGKELEYPVFKQIGYPPITGESDIFSIIRKRDILLHLPYHSYTPVLSFFNQAAIDADVTDIYITLYRVASESHIVNALISAAKNGKNVTCFIELKARFDEANNIKWSREMKNAGINLKYSDPKIKVHSKIGLVKKKSENKTVSFTILSTGNFNESTAKFYTDHVLLTSRPEIADEIQTLFEFLLKKNVSLEKNKLKFNELIISQFNMLTEFDSLIEKEIKKSKKGNFGIIRIKVNNLEDPWIIQRLYDASNAGVEVRLIVRSICCIVPGVKNESKNIIIKRIVDRFLEHTRLFIFGEGDDSLVFMGSSDLMIRNLRHRIEVCVKLRDKESRDEIIEYFEIQWRDNTNAVYISKELKNVPIIDNKTKFNAQQEIFKYLTSAHDRE